MRKKFRLKKEFRKLLILFLGMALATQLVGNSVVFAMNDASDVIATYEVGVEGNNVLATLTKDGTITLSGSGDTKDYTSDTMPFQDNISNIKDIVIEEGVTSIGNAMFYNCKDINGKLIIPSTIVEIGDYAFSGDSYDLAPKITKIENSFTQSNIVVETPVEKKAEENTTEKSSEEQVPPTVEEPTADTTQQDATPMQEEQPVQETVKTVKAITEQQIGQSVFVSGQNGGYSCAETNKSFIDAVIEAGYVRADRFVLVRMDSSITQEVPVINGQLVLPSKPDTLGIPAEDALTSYQFVGWTVEGSDNVLNPKDNYAISDGVEELNLTSQWQQTWKINPQVKTEVKEEASIYSVVDSNTGNVLENVNGYTMTVQWQINTKDKDDETSWENIENATSFTYERKAEAGDTKSYFRANISIVKQSLTRAIDQPTKFETIPVKGVANINQVSIEYQAGDGSGSAPEGALLDDGSNYNLKENTFVSPSNKVFTGWKIQFSNVSIKNNAEQTVSNNDVLLSSDSINITVTTGVPSIIFIAQYDTLSSVYVDSTVISSGDGSTPEKAVKTIDEAYEKLSVNGSVESNKILIVSDYTFVKGTITLGNKPATITSANKNNIINLVGDLSDLSPTTTNYIRCQADTKFENLGLMFNSKQDYTKPSGIYGYGHKLIMGKGLKTDGFLRVFGGTRYINESVESTDVVVYSGNYSMIAGGGYNGTVTKDTSVTMYGGYVTRTIYAGRGSGSENWETTGTIKGTAFVTIYNIDVSADFFGIQPTRAGIILGEGHDYAYVAKMYGGNVSNIFGEVHSPFVGTQGKKSLIEVYGGNVKGGVYGGSTDSNQYNGHYALTDGVDINIYGGKIGQIYGAGNDAYYTNAYQAMSGTKNINILGGEITGNIYGGSNLGTTSGDSIIKIENATIGGNVYGGGNGSNSRKATVTGNVNITLGNNSIVKGNVYGGGNQNGVITKDVIIIMKDNAETTNVYGAGNGSKTSVSGSSTIKIESGNIKENVYGGGELGTINISNIIISGGTVSESVYGGGNKIGVKTSNITLNNSSKIKNVYGGSNASGTTTESIINIKGTTNSNIYGGGNGAGTTVTTATVNIESTANITGNIFGGGELGTVETSNVNLNGGTITGNVFGGGNKVGVTTSNVDINQTIDMTDSEGAIFGGSNAEGTTTTSNVKVANQIGPNIYGGGFGPNTIVTKTNVTLMAGADTSGEVYGGGKEGIVVEANVVLESGSFGTAVFGGGHLVGVDNSVNVHAENGSIATNIYGGSNDSGIVNNTSVTVEGNIGNVYGAGKGSGTITENPSVTVKGTNVSVLNVYGGGEEGASKGITKVNISDSANNVENVYGAGNNAGVEGDTEIKVDSTSTVNSVYGGSNTTGIVTGTANITIDGTSLVDVFGGGKGEDTVVHDTKVVSSLNAHLFNVYGGSDAGIITTNTEMEIDGSVSESVYGAGKGATSNVKGNTHVVLFGATVTGDVFGGGNLGGIAGDSHVDLLSGTVEGSAFGGSNQALVHGNSKVHMGYSATDKQNKPDVMKMIVKKSIYGGGNITDSGKAFDASNPFVLGNSEVLINQEGYSSSDTDFQIGENILGDGNMCVTAGNKIISITNYKGIDNKKTLASIQRATTLSLDGSWIELTGSKDSANLLPTMEYSLSRIDTLSLNGNSTLNLYREVNLVRSLESYLNGRPVSESDAKGGGNSVILQQGIGLELRTNEDVSRPGYGAVIGYTRLGRYDKDGKDLMDGVYVLGGYDATNNGYGFVANENIMEKPGDTTPTIKAGDKLTPETNNQTWNNWRLGRRVDIVTRQIVVSDRPSLGKSIEIRSKWAADGSIYKIDKDSLTISYQNGSNENFTFVDPDKLSSGSGDVNSTFGLEIGTGQNGWLEQNKAGYVEGSTSGLTNTMVLQKDGKMTAIKNDQVYPLISVTLSNLTEITKSDAKVPVRVSFNVNTYTKQADGTDMKTGTMTINIDIIRKPEATYSDTTLEAGKNYKGAIKAYDYDTNKTSALTISETSSITLQYARKAKDGTAVPTKNELSFSTALPYNTKILMIDKSGNDTNYYNYKVIDPAGKLKIDLSEFVENGTAAGKYKPINNGNDAENYIFIIDFALVAPGTMNNIKATLTAYDGSKVISDKSIVFSVSGAQRVYTLASKQDDPKIFNRYSIGSTIPIDLTTTVTVGSGQIDTTGREKQMGARVRLYSVDNQSYINIPSTWEVISQGTHYSAGGNSFTIKLADGLTVTESKIYIQMSSIGNLPIGKYQLKVDLIGGALANYPENDRALATKEITIGIELTDYSYSIKSTMADKNKQLFSNTTPDKTVDIKLEKATSAGASTTGVYVQQTLYKKNEEAGEYESVDLTELFDSAALPPIMNKLAWDKNLLNYKYKSNISAGTYRLQFDVMQADAFNDLTKSGDIVRASDTINIVVTDD